MGVALSGNLGRKKNGKKGTPHRFICGRGGFFKPQRKERATWRGIRVKSVKREGLV